MRVLVGYGALSMCGSIVATSRISNSCGTAKSKV